LLDIRFEIDNEVGSASAQIPSCGTVYTSGFFIVLGRGAFGSGVGVFRNVERSKRKHPSKQCYTNRVGDWQIKHCVCLGWLSTNGPGLSDCLM